MARFSVATTALCLALGAPSSQAFTGIQFRPLTTSSPVAANGSSSVLHMNLFDRFARVAKSNLNDLANKLEDPEKIMGQAIEEMQVSFFRFFFVNILFLPWDPGCLLDLCAPHFLPSSLTSTQI